MRFNGKYLINNGNQSIVFKEGKGNTITGEYNDGTLTGTMEENVLKATFHNKKNNSAGLIEITFNENGFAAKWKEGLEAGPMRGKWKGLLNNNSMLNNKFEHKSTIIISLRLDDPISDPEQNSECLIRKQKLVGYLKAIIYLLNELTDEVYGKDQLGHIEFLLKNKNQSYTGKSGIDLLNKMCQAINSENDITDELHKSLFFENAIWPDVEMKKIDFDESFVYSSWDNSYILLGFNRFAHEIKENINSILFTWGDENIDWNLEIGDKESNSKYGHYFAFTVSEAENYDLDEEGE